MERIPSSVTPRQIELEGVGRIKNAQFKITYRFKTNAVCRLLRLNQSADIFHCRTQHRLGPRTQNLRLDYCCAVGTNFSNFVLIFLPLPPHRDIIGTLLPVCSCAVMERTSFYASTAVSQKNQDTPITLPSVDRCLKFFHRQTQQ